MPLILIIEVIRKQYGQKKFGESIQRFGRTLLLPIGVLAPIGMILGISGALVQTYMIARFPFSEMKRLMHYLSAFVQSRVLFLIIFPTVCYGGLWHEPSR